MRSLRLCSVFLCLLAIILVIIVAGCGGSSSSSPSTPASPPGSGSPGGGSGGSGGGNGSSGGGSGNGGGGGGGAPQSTSTFVYIDNGNPITNIFALKLNSDGTLANTSGSPFSDPKFLTVGQSNNFLIGISASDHLTVYSVNTQTGVPQSPVSSLSRSGSGVTDGKTLYLSASSGDGLDAYSISPSGQLTLVPGSPFDAANNTVFTNSYERLQIVGSLLFGSFNTVKDAGDINVFSRAANGALTKIGDVGNGNVPFGFVAHPNGRFVYVVNDVPGLDVYDRNNGTNTPIQSVPDNSGGFIVVDPSGKFLLMHDNGIREFSIDQSSGKLTEMTGSPLLAGDNSIRSFDFDPSGHFLVVVRQNTVTAMTLNAATGALIQANPGTSVGENLIGVQFAVF
jgi:6-phosphogluconolactonase (cycloisomerase 2 family)